MRRYLARMLSQLTFPAQGHKSRDWIAEREPKLDKQVQSAHSIHAKTFSFKNNEGSALDAVEVLPTTFDVSKIKDSPVVLFLNGYDSCYERNLLNFYKYSEHLQLPFYSFNYRGVIRSEGYPDYADDLVQDSVSAVKHLIKLGYSPEKIVILGHSLGGGIGAVAAHQLHKEKIPVKLYADRTFASFSRAAVGMKVKPKFVFGFMLLMGGLISLCAKAAAITLSWPLLGAITLATAACSSTLTYFFPHFMKALFKPVVWLIINVSGWEINALDAFHAIPNKDKAYTIAKSPSDKLKLDWNNDPIRHTGEKDTYVTEEASLNQGLKEKNAHSKPKVEELRTENYNPHGGEYLPAWDKVSFDVKQVKYPKTDAHKTEKTSHGANLDHLLGRYTGIDGLTRFGSFVQAATQTQIKRHQP